MVEIEFTSQLNKIMVDWKYFNIRCHASCKLSYLDDFLGLFRFFMIVCEFSTKQCGKLKSFANRPRGATAFCP
jgi:hypothetical protein